MKQTRKTQTLFIMSAYHTYNIKGYVVEVSKSRNYYRIIGDFVDDYSTETPKVISREKCFQLNIVDGKPRDIELRHQVFIENAQLTLYEEDETNFDVENQSNIITLIKSHTGIFVEMPKVGVEYLKAYLSKSYHLPEWSGIQNIAHIEGIVVYKNLSNRIVRVITEQVTPHANPCYMCFEIHMTEEVYDFYNIELEIMEIGDTLLVKGSVFYVNNSFKHAKFTYDYEQEMRKKVVIHIQAKQLIKKNSTDRKIIQRCIYEYLNDKFRIGTYGDRHSYVSPKVKVAYL